MAYQETFVQRNEHRIFVREYSGEEPTIILMHGLPDNLHLYDRLAGAEYRMAGLAESASVERSHRQPPPTSLLVEKCDSLHVSTRARFLRVLSARLI